MKHNLHEWTTWEGGECPLSVSAFADIKLRNGKVLSGVVASRYLWGRAACFAESFFENGGDIVAYRMVEEMA